MKFSYVVAALAGSLLIGCCVFAAPLPTTPVTNDLWDINRGTTIIASSPMLKYTASDPRNMFGGNYGWIEVGNTIFDDLADGASYTSLTSYVQWRTSSTVTIDSFNLFANHDGGSRNAYYRGFDYFDLYAYTGSWQRIYHYDATNPYAPGTATPNELKLFATINPVSAQYFMAEFTRYNYVPQPLGEYSTGPRILELDGFCRGAAVPEPATMSLLGLGLAGVGLLRRKK